MADIAQNSTSSRTQNRDKLFTAREYSLKLLIQMHEFRKSKIMCDEFLKVGGRIFAAHRVVLCAASSYFQAMFTGGLAETFDENVEIYGIDADTFAIILDFIYSGYVEVKETNVQQLLPAAKMLQIEEVEKNCCDFLRHELDPSNCVGIYLFADVHACVNLASDALEYIHRNFAEVSKSEEFLQLDKLRLFKLLESEDLKIESEEQVFEAAINWVLSDVKGRRELLGKILEKVRLPLISSTYFDNFLAKCQNASVQRMLEGILENFRKYQMLARGLKIHMQPRKASRKCFYVIGGYSRRVGGRWSDTISLSTVEKFDTFTKKCDSFSTAQMSYPRSGHGVTAVGGMLYAIGGENDSLIYDTTECYNPIENSWSLVAPMLTPRVACGVCVVEDFIYVIGGWVGSEIADDIERYDPQEDKWEVVGKVNTHRFHLGVTELNGLIYAVGRCLTLVYQSVKLQHVVYHIITIQLGHAHCILYIKVSV